MSSRSINRGDYSSCILVPASRDPRFCRHHLCQAWRDPALEILWKEVEFLYLIKVLLPSLSLPGDLICSAKQEVLYWTGRPVAEHCSSNLRYILLSAGFETLGPSSLYLPLLEGYDTAPAQKHRFFHGRASPARIYRPSRSPVQYLRTRYLSQQKLRGAWAEYSTPLSRPSPSAA